MKHFNFIRFLLFVFLGSSVLSSCWAVSEKSEFRAEGAVEKSFRDAGVIREKGELLPSLMQKDLTRYIQPMIGTGGAGFAVGSALPGATLPFGLAKVSPDTVDHSGLGFNHCAGYAYGDRRLVGFSHLHLHGTGVPDYGNLLFLPVREKSTKFIVQKEFAFSFEHAQEKASAGYYSVILAETKIRAEMTVSERAAYHRYSYPDGDFARVLIRLDHVLPGGKILDSALAAKDKYHLEGWLHHAGSMSGRHGGYKLYFVVESVLSFQGTFWKDGRWREGEKSLTGSHIGILLSYPKGTKKVELRVGLSLTGIEEARRNLREEIGKRSFDEVREAAKRAWEEVLARIKIAGGTERQRRIFYTALYHAYQMPTLLSDVGGSYVGLDKKRHLAKGFRYYSDFSLWDTYRTLHPLLTLIDPKRTLEMIRSLVVMQRDGGFLPRWPLATGYTGTMVGESATIVIADAYLKGIQGFDIEAAYRGMRRLALQPVPPNSPYSGRVRTAFYAQHGYLPGDKVKGSASIALEYAYNDFAIAQLAKILGKTKDYELFLQRSKNYRHLWDPQLQFFRAKKSDGNWLTQKFNPTAWTKDFVEGDAWQYLWFVPYDVEGLAALFGGRQPFLKKLDRFFDESLMEYELAERKLGLKKYYWHGNEPDIHAATLYLLLGEGAKSDRWIRWIMETRYDDSPAGLAGNDDAGTLSAWYVFNAIGLYPIPARKIYLLTTPIFSRIQLTIEGKTIEIRALNTSSKNRYVGKIYLNGQLLQHRWISHEKLLKDGNILTFEMISQPPNP